MTFDNKKTSYKIYLRKFYLAISVTLLIILLLFSGLFEDPLLGLTKTHYIIIVACIYFLVIVINFIRQQNYFYFNDNGKNIIIRYYPLRPMARSRKSIEIPKARFAGFEIRNSLLGIKKILILKQTLKKSVAHYPPISISSLTREELAVLTRQLSLYKPST
jgi:hypothetical protein